MTGSPCTTHGLSTTQHVGLGDPLVRETGIAVISKHAVAVDCLAGCQMQSHPQLTPLSGERSVFVERRLTAAGVAGVLLR